MADEFEKEGALATLLSLGARVRLAASPEALGFIAVNETYRLSPYRQAVLMLGPVGRRRVAALSGLAELESGSPYVQWLHSVSGAIDKGPNTLRTFLASDLEGDARDQWSEWWPGFACLIALEVERGFEGGLLILVRDEPWGPGELALLNEWRGILTHGFSALARPSFLRLLRSPLEPSKLGGEGEASWLKRRTPLQLASFLGLLLLFLPVRLTVLAEAELVPSHPAIVRAPMDGVVEEVLVRPNQSVEEGTPLLAFDRLSLEGQLRVGERALAAADAEFRQAAQRALIDERRKESLAAARGELEKRLAELAFLRELAERSTILAPQKGVVLFGDPTEWVGRPVVLGERIMVVADPADSEVQFWLSLGDAIPLQEGGSLTLFLDADPLSPLTATLSYLSYTPVERPSGYFAYRGRAILEGAPKERARVGVTGTAKLAAGHVPLIYWVLRRPLAALRGWLGW